ncbi:MAG: ribonuclease R [Clostridiales bacterium]|nr:ribonuclease R [Clostridiales bacterium]
MSKDLIKDKRKIILDIINDPSYVPMKAKELGMLLQIPRKEREELKNVLSALVDAGKVNLSRKGKYTKPIENSLTGTFEATTRGFGFVSIEGEDEDIFIKESSVNGALNKDTVQIIILPESGGKRREGEVIKIISRGIAEIVGIYQKSKNFGFVISDNLKFSKDIYVSSERSMGAVTGHKVVVKITDYGSNTKKPEGIVTEIIGHINDPGTDIMSIVKSYEIPVDFPDKVLKQIETIPNEVSSDAMAGRMDIRDWQMVTIDGEDAKDLDDAVTLTREKEHYILGVHIADVTHYVTEGSPLDEEALKRGTSVYLVDRVIPMIPHKLSNGICSLNASVDRLALSCIMEIDFKGNVIGHKVAETLINVDRRMSYTSIKKILEDKDEEEMKEYSELIPMFENMKELADILREKRKQRGSIDFDFPETKIILDEKGKPIDIKPYERNSATKIIEDFMLITNETIAEDFYWQELPFVYRTHDTPDAEKIQALEIFINNFGYGIKSGKEGIHPKELQKLLVRIEDSPEEALISRLTLRSMKQAKYTIVNSGHFGLSSKYYCHFTSPIRRYPDLQIHRIIKENLNGKISEKRVRHYDKILTDVATHSSLTERRADEAERDTEKLKKVEYMSKRIGQQYEGIISGITNYGMYVELPNTVEGMIHVTALKDDYYFYDDEKYEMIGEKTHKVYKLGEKIEIVVTGADKIQRTIDFEPVESYMEEEGILDYGERVHEVNSEQ